jgi:hypothetical protein
MWQELGHCCLLADYVIPVSLLSHSSFSYSICRHNTSVYTVLHEPPVKTEQHQILRCAVIITFSKPTQLKQFIHKGEFL